VSWPQYAGYRRSGVSWIGDVPDDWPVMPLKRRFSVTVGKMLNAGATVEEGEIVPYLRAGNVQPSGLNLDEVKHIKLTASERHSLDLRRGDLVVVEGGAGYGRSAYLREDLPGWSFQNHILRVRPKSADSNQFLGYVVRSLYTTGHIASLSNHATIPSLSSEQLSRILIPLPDAVTQAAVVSFLDAETAKIDGLVAKQEQLIATLREDRAATITHAVTKGLDPDVEMKDSGAAWIGQVPATWTVSKVKHGFSVVLGKMYQGEKQAPTDRLLPHLKAGSLTESLKLNLDDPMLCWFSPEELRKLSIRADDLLVVEGGATYGRCVIVREDLPDWGFQKSLNRVRAEGRDSIRFLAYLVQAATEIGHVSVLCGKATIPHFTAEKLESLEWPHPSPAEQQQIADYLDRRCAAIEELILKALEVIETLREYRAALIADAVTGKIDVRGAA
jgi:type I restriction enzyme, S subunit